MWMARVKYNLTNNLSCDIAVQGKDYQSLYHYNNSGLYCGNYIQSVTPNLSLGTEVLWQPEHNMSRINFAARYNTNKMSLLRGNVDSDGVVSAYIEQKIRYGVKLFLLAKLDHVKGNYGFGFAVNIGEEQKLSVDD
ncbi:mitochondrial import receptor subunit TOM40-2 [Carex littledalei]|uniref:Mitochondrial import receptor subunit TOM40-2 n=1 Tax=Carex littledalei TaxID=544730 RepID=A0A833QIA0_9POAL|nr:mitochondrial import receptor subunit TOM40-2 [Carex littledalei]